MELLIEFFSFFSPSALESNLVSAGLFAYFVIALVIWLETAVPVGLVTPGGPSLLFISGVVAATGGMDFAALWLILVATTIFADSFGYWLGKRTGDAVWNRPDGWLVKRRHLERTHAFFERYGQQTVLLSRFVGVVRTLAPFMAGVARMSYPRFLAWNIPGGVLWITVFVGSGYFFGNLLWVRTHISWMVLLVVLASVLPLFLVVNRAKSLHAAKAAAPSGDAAPVASIGATSTRA